MSEKETAIIMEKVHDGSETNTAKENEAFQAKISLDNLDKNSDPDKIDNGDDPWQLPEVAIDTVKWSELDTKGKVKRVLVSFILKPICLVALLYLFICSLDLLSAAFRLLGGKAAGRVFQQSEIFNNPIAGLMIGLLVTVLVQSSSTSTSIIVTMVGSDLLTVQMAVPMIFGCNIGTTVTNTIVSLPQSGNKEEFRRAFAGATVHDCFNWLTVLILLPIEAGTHFMEKMTKPMVKGITSNPDANVEILKVITEPFTKLIVMLDKSVIEQIAQGVPGAEDLPVLKTWCKFVSVNETKWNETFNFSYVEEVDYGVKKCASLFSQFETTDLIAGICVLIISLALLCSCLILLVKLLHSLLKGQIAIWLRKIINANFPGVFKYFTDYVTMLVGTGITIIVQSSSIFTSALTPLVGIGLITVERMFPLTLGSNIGTTVTGILASLANTGENLANAMQIALVHLFFNVIGIFIWYPIPVIRRVPIRAAKFLGNTTANYRWFAVAYILCFYFIFPFALFGLSIVHLWAVLGVVIFLVVVVAFIIVVNVLQSHAPRVLPRCMRTWEFLPEPMRSLAPYDRVFAVCGICCKQRCKCCKKDNQEDMEVASAGSNPPSYNETDFEKPPIYTLEDEKLSHSNPAFEDFDSSTAL